MIILSPANILELKAPAKINLTLEILYRRSDGFHELRTVMQELEYGDLLCFTELPDGQIKLFCDEPSLPGGEENLAWRAAALMQDYYAPKRGVRLDLAKKIPVAAGLGGGSSDAAAVLKGLNILWRLNLGPEKLHDLAAQIGSDVPFFLYGGTALAEGRGELIRPLPPLPSFPVLLVAMPQRTLSTALVYRALKWEKIKSGEKTGNLVHLLAGEDGSKRYNHVLMEELFSVMVNDLERPAFALAGELASLKKELQELGLRVLLSGSGPTFFALSHDPENLTLLAAELEDRGYVVIRTRFKSGD